MYEPDGRTCKIIPVEPSSGFLDASILLPCKILDNFSSRVLNIIFITFFYVFSSTEKPRYKYPLILTLYGL